MDNAYNEYIAALEAREEIACERAYKRIEGNATFTEMLALDRQLLAATNKCMRAWAKVREAHTSEQDE